MATATRFAHRNAKSVLRSLHSLVCRSVTWADDELTLCGFTTDLHIRLNTIIDVMALSADAPPQFVGGDAEKTVRVLSALLSRWTWTSAELTAASLTPEVVEELDAVVTRMSRMCRSAGISLSA